MVRVLVIEDSEFDRVLYRRWLVDFDVTFVGSMKEFRNVAREDWDLIICDYMLPDVEGNELYYLLEFVARCPWFGVSNSPGTTSYDGIVPKDRGLILAKIEELGVGN